MSSEHLLVEQEGPVARIVMNRPEKHNALLFDDVDVLARMLHDLEEDDDVKVIILKGRGPSFCAGHDYNDAAKAYGFEAGADGAKPRRPSQRTRLLRDRRLGEGYKALHYALKPVIAQVHGVCTGVGIYFVELADLAIAANTARFSHAEQRMGLAGNTWHLNSQLLTYGPKRARELLLLGDDFDGAAAERLGLVNMSVAEDELEETVELWAARIAQHPRDALVTGRAMFIQAMDSLGGSEQFSRGFVGHTLGTNLRFESDEFNFLRERQNVGTREAFARRQGFYEDSDDA